MEQSDANRADMLQRIERVEKLLSSGAGSSASTSETATCPWAAARREREEAATHRQESSKKAVGGRVILTTENHIMVEKEEIIELANAIAVEAGPAAIERRVAGAKTAKSFSVTFGKGNDDAVAAMYAEQFVASRYKNGQWEEARVKGPGAASGDQGVQIYINLDKEASQRRGDFAWRCLRRSVAAMREGVIGDARKRIIAVGCIGVARVRFDTPTETYRPAWLPHAEKTFTEADRTKLERDFDAGELKGASWG